jgi:hypothetical protein
MLCAIAASDGGDSVHYPVFQTVYGWVLFPSLCDRMNYRITLVCLSRASLKLWT